MPITFMTAPLPPTYASNNFYARRDDGNVLYMQKHDDLNSSPMRCSLSHPGRITWCPFATQVMAVCPGCKETLQFPHGHEMLPHLLRQDLCSCASIGRAVAMRYIDLADTPRLSSDPDYWHILHVDTTHHGQVIPVWVSRHGRIGVGCYAKLGGVEQCIVIVRGRWSVRNLSCTEVQPDYPPVLYHPIYSITNVLGLQPAADYVKNKFTVDWATSTSQRLDAIFRYFATSMRSIVWNGLPTEPALIAGPAPASPPLATHQGGPKPSPALLAKDIDDDITHQLPESECSI